ncbi:MAG TPA: hypothetical protein VFW23_04850 [Tepidisphaeraceae bacterium]|nr:hypothetical protein [Tepidisphaeraceae bacterium]
MRGSHPSRPCNAIVESLESRRLLSAALIGSFASPLPASLVAGSAGQIAVRITNPNLTAVKGAAVDVYASADQSLDSSDVLIGTSNQPRTFRHGAGATINIKYDLPAGLADGNYYFVASVAGSGGAEDVFPTVTQAAIGPAHAELVTLFASTPTGALKTNGINSTQRCAWVEVVNVGNVAAHGKVNVDLYLSPTNVLNGSASQTAHIASARLNLKPHRAATFMATLGVPNGLTPGTYRLFAVTTSLNGIASQSNPNGVGAAVQTVGIISTVPLPVLAGDDIPPDFSPPPAPSVDHNSGGSSTQPATDPADDSWDSGLIDATTDTGSNDSSSDNSSGDFGSSDSSGSYDSSGGDFSNSGDSSDSGDW